MGLRKVILMFLILIPGNVAVQQRNVSTEETFFLLDSMKVEFADQTLTPHDRKKDKRTDYNPDESDSNEGIPEYLHKNSTCPWKYVKVVNKNRIPKTIIEAECTTSISSECIIPGNTAAKDGHRKQHQKLPFQTSECKPIKYLRWVKVRKGKRSKKYDDRLLPITVGCTCAYTNIRSV